jgi:beta-glucosidase
VTVGETSPRVDRPNEGTGFLWGAATSAYQVEGAVREDGRGVSIWDTFCRRPGAIRAGDTGDVACDQYHRFEDDIALMARLGIGAYRFSIAWPRILPDGDGAVNQSGLDHYRRVVEALNRHGIAPVVTLYHWDLPQALEDLGGWTNRDTASRFADYATIVHGALAGEVPTWTTINEPWVAAWLGYGTGVHAPGKADHALALAASHHLLLAHGLAVEAMDGDGAVGITLNLQPTTPASLDADDVLAARRADLQMNAYYLDPIFGRGYPEELVEFYRSVTDMAFVRDGDLDVIAGPFDILGVNYYRRFTVTADPGSRGAEELPGSLGAWSIVPEGVAVTGMGWPVEPEVLTELLTRTHREYAPARILITENGAAYEDVVGADSRIDDTARVAYLRDHVRAALRAKEAGVPIEGYFVWSLLDNFEWAQGFSKRFGLAYVDFETQARIPKLSAHWYQQVARRGEPNGMPPERVPGAGDGERG